ncbi:MAG: YggS family pyridoxal phosphate-dependent enzyme [Acidobacteria bacterium]|nr:YggS family pyridoxal phosphate-dependent enzyme [Acidobacteriota bacterium]
MDAQIERNIRFVQKKIADAAAACGRSAGEIALLAISKTFPVESISGAAAAGLSRFGENRVQEAEAKILHFRQRSRFEWHLVGHLQTNKARRAAELFDCIHSLDSLRLAEKLNQACLETGKKLSVLLQVDLGREETKFGADPEQVRDIVEAVSFHDGLILDGLMTVPPFFEDPEQARPYFVRLRELKDALEAEQPGCLGHRHLSMGMSHDFETAIGEGATIVRIGTSIFGSRHYG